MDFQEMEAETVPDVNVEQVLHELSDLDNSSPSHCLDSETQLVPSVDTTEHQPVVNMNSGDGPATVFQKMEPLATTSKSKHVSVPEGKKGIQEFIRVLRPHLPRKSKSRAYKLLQNIAKGIIVSESSFQPKRRQKKPKRRPIRKAKFQLRKLKSKSMKGLRRNARSLYDTSSSSQSEASCPRCGYSCCRFTRF